MHCEKGLDFGTKTTEKISSWLVLIFISKHDLFWLVVWEVSHAQSAWYQNSEKESWSLFRTALHNMKIYYFAPFSKDWLIAEHFLLWKLPAQISNPSTVPCICTWFIASNQSNVAFSSCPAKKSNCSLHQKGTTAIYQ